MHEVGSQHLSGLGRGFMRFSALLQCNRREISVPIRSDAFDVSAAINVTRYASPTNRSDEWSSEISFINIYINKAVNKVFYMFAYVFVLL
jgi:hypothetical protein